MTNLVDNNLTEQCVNASFLLPIVNAEMINQNVRIALYIVFMLYLLLGIIVGMGTFMTAMEATLRKKRPNWLTASDQRNTPEEPSGIEENHQQPVASHRKQLTWTHPASNYILIGIAAVLPELAMPLLDVIDGRFVIGQLSTNTMFASSALKLMLVPAFALLLVPAGKVLQLNQPGDLVVNAVYVLISLFFVALVWQMDMSGMAVFYSAALLLAIYGASIVTMHVTHKSGNRRLPTAKFLSQMKKMRLPKKKPKTNGQLEIDEPPIEQPDLVGDHTNSPDLVLPTDDGMDTDDQKVTRKSKREKKSKSKKSAKSHKSITIPEEPEEPIEDEPVNEGGASDWLSLAKQISHQQPNLTPEQIADRTASHLMHSHGHTPIHYRLGAARAIVASGSNLNGSYDVNKVHPESVDDGQLVSTRSEQIMNQSENCVIQFTASKYAATDVDSFVHLTVLRVGRNHRRVLFKYATVDGTAHANRDYQARTETLVLNPSELEKTITIQLMTNKDKDHDKETDDRMFYVKLALEDFADGRTMIGENSMSIVQLVTGERDSKVSLTSTSELVHESAGQLSVKVARRGNVKNTIAVDWQTVAGTARPNRHFMPDSGLLTFNAGEVEKKLTVAIIDEKKFDKHVSFSVSLMSVHGPSVSMSSKKRQCLVTIVNDDSATQILTAVGRLLAGRIDKRRAAGGSWRHQFVLAANVNGADVNNAKSWHYLVHTVTLLWKLLFACVPPPSLVPAAVSIVCSALLILVLSLLLRDTVSITSCLTGTSQAVWGQLLLATAFNLPDLVAVRYAAVNEQFADAVIGHLVSSVSCLVLVGVGMPLLVAFFIQGQRGSTIQLDDPDLVMFQCVLLGALLTVFTFILLLRRCVSFCGKAELGGVLVIRVLCALLFVLFWIGYTVLVLGFVMPL